jgi:hypothetical protein
VPILKTSGDFNSRKDRKMAKRQGRENMTEKPLFLSNCARQLPSKKRQESYILRSAQAFAI